MINTVKKENQGFIPKNISPDQAKDTGMAMVLICLLIVLIGHKQQFLGVAVVVLLINMTKPILFKPLAKIWLGLSHLMGTVMSKIILSILFFGMVTPLGFIRKCLGKDSLQIKKWKKERTSVFRIRDHLIKADDIKHPF